MNEAREKSEEIIDILYSQSTKKQKKPRTYRIKARKDFLAVAKKRNPNQKHIRKAVRKQLQYVQRNLRHIGKLVEKTGLTELTKRQYRNLLVIQEVYRQQKSMYDQKIHRVADRIVSISQPHVRPIVRGKAGKPVEFGMKVSLSVVEGYTFIDRMSWDAYNESTDLVQQVEAYQRRFGVLPESVHADQIYRTRFNRTWCKQRDIRLSGTKLGRPSTDTVLLRTQKKQMRNDEINRIEVEGRIGNSKQRYGLDRLKTKTAITSETQAMVGILVMNLDKILRDLFLHLLFSSDLVTETWFETGGNNQKATHLSFLESDKLVA